MLHVVKQYHRPDCNAFDVFGRVLSGTVFRGDRVKILGSLNAPKAFAWPEEGSSRPELTKLRRDLLAR